MGKLVDITGCRFGRLTVIGRAPSVKSPCGSTRTYWKCRCDCGNEVTVGKTHLLCGDTTSCGCYRKEVSSAKSKTHGDRKGEYKRLYALWITMRMRCTDHGAEPDTYYNKGIRVCEEWENNYLAFKAWALSNGYDIHAKRGETTIDRIDPNGGYSPENCRIVNMKTQNRNKRNTIKDTINGVTKPRSEWCEIYHADPALVGARMRRGWNIIDALTKPPRKLTRRTENA